MAQLTRTVKLVDSAKTQTFTFVLPNLVFEDAPTEILSREFLYEGVRWQIRFERHDLHLNPTVVMCSHGLQCSVDVSLSLINRESFTQNETFADQKMVFSIPDKQQHTKPNFVTLKELITRKFTDQKGEFLVDLTLRNLTVFTEQVVYMDTSQRTINHKRSIQGTEGLDYQRYDTGTFQYGDVDWNISFCPNMELSRQNIARHLILLNRKTKLDIVARISYQVHFGAGDKRISSPVRNDTLDFTGDGVSWYFDDNYQQHLDHSRATIRVQLFSFHCMSQAVFDPAAGSLPHHMHDRSKQTWTLSINKVDEEQNKIRFRLAYTDASKVPPHYLRYVSWNLLVRSENTVTATSGPYINYYVRKPTSEKQAFEMEVAVPPEVIVNKQKVFADLEWIDSYLLCNAYYHVYDDIVRRHMHQMRREVNALQSENSQLERELHNVHMSLANKCDGGTPKKGGGESVIAGGGKSVTSANHKPPVKQSPQISSNCVQSTSQSVNGPQYAFNHTQQTHNTSQQQPVNCSPHAGNISQQGLNYQQVSGQSTMNQQPQVNGSSQPGNIGQHGLNHQQVNNSVQSTMNQQRPNGTLGPPGLQPRSSSHSLNAAPPGLQPRSNSHTQMAPRASPQSSPRMSTTASPHHSYARSNNNSMTDVRPPPSPTYLNRMDYAALQQSPRRGFIESLLESDDEDGRLISSGSVF